MKEPGPDHPITVAPHPGTVRVRAGGRLIAETTAALCMAESDYPPVYYVPRTDVDMTLLVPSDHSTYCPFKGEASYFDVMAAEGALENAVWSYESPYPAVAAIREHLAFYTDKVEVEAGIEAGGG